MKNLITLQKPSQNTIHPELRYTPYQNQDTYLATVHRIRHLDSRVAEISFTSDLETYQAGQYITILLPNSSTPEGKAYSLASAPFEQYFSITIKRVGEYSGFLYNLKPGDSFLHSRAYGYFNPDTKLPLIGMASGVGISPVYSVLKQTLNKYPKHQTTLVYSTKTIQDAAMIDSIKDLEHQTSLKLFHHQTRNNQAKLNQRINPEEYFDPNSVYLLCGSVSFTRDMFRSLTNLGVDEKHIHTEVFFE